MNVSRSQASRRIFPRWQVLVGFCLGTVGSCIILLLGQNDPRLQTIVPTSGFLNLWVNGSALLAWAVLLLGGIFGMVAARWSWEWAMGPDHPLLSWLESWTPIRGRWVVLLLAPGAMAIFWVALWLLTSRSSCWRCCYFPHFPAPACR